MLIPVRRIVTHNDEEGRSFALLDDTATNVIGTLTELWTTDQPPHNHRSTKDAGAASESLEPVAGGTVFRYFQIPPQSSLAHLSLEQKQNAWRELFEKMHAPHAQPDTTRDPGMHTSSTTDYIILLQGQITLVLEPPRI